MATLPDFNTGYLQTDGYASYNDIDAREGVCRAGCMAHARRYFFDARNNNPERAGHALKTIQQIYAHEQKAKGFKGWLNEQACIVTPKSPIGRAFTYLPGHTGNRADL